MMERILELKPDFLLREVWGEREKEGFTSLLEERHGGYSECRKYFLYHVLIASSIKPEECEFLDFDGEDSIEKYLERRYRELSAAEETDVMPGEHREEMRHLLKSR